LPLVSGHDRDEIVVCPPDIDLATAVESAKGSNVTIGGQNVHWKPEGAFTGVSVFGHSMQSRPKKPRTWSWPTSRCGRLGREKRPRRSLPQKRTRGFAARLR